MRQNEGTGSVEMDPTGQGVQSTKTEESESNVPPGQTQSAAES